MDSVDVGETSRKRKAEEMTANVETTEKTEEQAPPEPSVEVEVAAPAATVAATEETKEGEAKSDEAVEIVMTEAEEATAESQDETTQEAAVPDSNPPEEPLPPPKPKQNPYDSLKWIVVRNDGKSESMIKLIGLKTLFAKQLPKMPRAYIARLVLDQRHTSLAILSDNPAVRDSDEEIIGGICYRAFPEMRFAEIAFCAVNATHQVKGYGTKLMNLFKTIAARTGIEYFITYADNYAIGYFKKQGFTKNISMPKGRYFGLIKDYDGGTPMECYVHPSVDFTRIPEMLEAQREFILRRIELTANSRKVYDPLPRNFSASLDGVSRANHAAARALAIPGIMEAGWTLADLTTATGQGKEGDRQKNALKSELISIIRKIDEQPFAWPFRDPVDTSAVPDYLEVIKEPIDLSTIDKRVRQDNHYRSKQMLLADLMLMVNNCKLYNDDSSTYVQCAVSLENYLGSLGLS